MTIWRMKIAFWITKATHIHSQYVIRNAFPLHQWLRERTPMLRYTYIACLVFSIHGNVLATSFDNVTNNNNDKKVTMF
jgi:hypothetical protein